jgi:hypothetical protein
VKVEGGIVMPEKVVGWRCPDGCWYSSDRPHDKRCPHCGSITEVVTPESRQQEELTPDGNPRDQSASVNYVIDEKAWKAVTDDAGKVMGAAYKRLLQERYAAFTTRLARIVAEKQIAYGDSFRHTREVLKILYPNGVTVEQYGDLLTITRIVDKLFRVANQKGYGGEDPYEDIAGYATRAACEDKDVASTSNNNTQEEPIDLG